MKIRTLLGGGVGQMSQRFIPGVPGGGPPGIVTHKYVNPFKAVVATGTVNPFAATAKYRQKTG